MSSVTVGFSKANEDLDLNYPEEMKETFLEICLQQDYDIRNRTPSYLKCDMPYGEVLTYEIRTGIFRIPKNRMVRWEVAETAKKISQSLKQLDENLSSIRKLSTFIQNEN